MQIKSALFFSTLLIAIFSFHSSYASQQNSTLDSQGNYANPSLGFSFQAPAGWTVEEPKKSQPGAPDVAVIAPYSAGFTASISFSVAETNGTSLVDYTMAQERELAAGNQSGNILLLSQEDSSVEGFPAKTYLIEEKYSPQEENGTVKFKQDIIDANNKFYTITYANVKNDFEAGLPQYAQLLGTIKFESGQSSPISDYIPIGIAATALVGGGIVVYMRKRHARTS